MKKSILIVPVFTLLFTLSMSGQNLFFMGSNSYHCTETFTLKTDSNSFFATDLNVLFAKDGEGAVIILNSETGGDLIRGRVFVYLEDGAVITLEEEEKWDFVNERASAVYHLTYEDFQKLKNSNVHTVRYWVTEEQDDLTDKSRGFRYSASNKDGDLNFAKAVTEFFGELEYYQEVQTNDKAGTSDLNSKGYLGNLGNPETGDYRLGNRKPLSKPMPEYKCEEEGLIVVRIEVNREGIVTKATAGAKGSTNTASCLLSQAENTALKTIWSADTKAAERQVGEIRYRFSLTN